MLQLINWLFRKKKSSTSLSLAQEDLANRIPVWAALSSLWLEKVPDNDAIAQILGASPYSEEQIGEICLYEVAPQFYNQQDIVGRDRGGFDMDWLTNRILTTLSQPDWYAWVWRHRKRIMAPVETTLKAVCATTRAYRRVGLKAVR